jgi:hypothetical protein
MAIAYGIQSMQAQRKVADTARSAFNYTTLNP